MKSSLSLVPAALLLGAGSAAADALLQFNSAPEIETRSLDAIHQAALAEGGVVTLWHGGDETNQQDGLKQQFEERFPGMTLNVTVDLSKYHDGAFDRQLATGKVEVDSLLLQTLQDYPRWAGEGALLNYAPVGFDQVDPAYKDSASAAWHSAYIISWSIIANTRKLGNVTINDWEDILRPEFKNKLVLTYPNDDDAVLFAFDLILQHQGMAWFDALLAQNPRWVRGTATPVSAIFGNGTDALTFTSEVGWQPIPGIQITKPKTGPFVAWAQGAAIPKDAPHPEGAKLLHNWILSTEFQQGRGWSVRQDIPLPDGFPWAPLDQMNNTNVPAFARWMGDRERVGRLKDYFESRIGSPQGLSPLTDDL
ncbi:ABC transporter [Plectosphaerella plurivora]|uniref:ABC transporter n=1 Tax=Plectosphaerella plurivora TaxID=936078 RepID=A0A9P8V5X2_9PEZI|nr:ABC transporter [Plectosphaerella plurivora]